MRTLTCLFLFLGALSSSAQTGLTPYYSRRIPLRDGKWLAADFYTRDSNVAKPVLLVQTPYNKNFYRTNQGIPSTAGGLIIPFDSAKYHLVVLDWRGFFGSAAAATANPDRSNDGYDAVEWIAAQPWCNGRVGTWGISALARAQYWTMAKQPPALRCAMPGAAEYISEYSEYYPGGCYLEETGQTQDQLGFSTASLILQNPTENATWDFAAQQSDLTTSIAIPCLTFTGWYDLDPQAVLRTFWNRMRTRSAASVRNQHKLMIGPWLHGKMDASQQGVFTYPDAANVLFAAAQQFFDYYLLDSVNNGYNNQPLFRFYQTGENSWVNDTSWFNRAGRQTTRLFLRPNGGLGTRPDETLNQTFAYDPRNPSPTYGGNRLLYFTSTEVDGPVDIRQAVESRPDAVTFETGLLQQPLRVNGTLKATLYFRADRTDSDLHIRLTDVQPDGRSVIIRTGAKRLRFRRSTRSATLLTPNATDSATVELPDIAYTFGVGHRLRMVVTGSNFPYYNRNLNNGGPLNTAGDTLIANLTLLGGPATPSRLELQTVGGIVTANEPLTALKPSGSLLAYPNPATTLLTVTNLPPNCTALRIADLNGKVVLQQAVTTGEQQVSLNLQLPAGLYVATALGDELRTALVAVQPTP